MSAAASAGFGPIRRSKQTENRELQPLSDLSAGSQAEIVRLAEHDGDLLHWYYDEGLVPGTRIEVREAGGGELTLSVAGDERPLDEKQAWLDEWLRQHQDGHGVRFYAEPTFLFDE